MIDTDQHEIRYPDCEPVNGPSVAERLDMERGRAWAYYLNGGGGDPHYFDLMSCTRNVERER